MGTTFPVPCHGITTTLICRWLMAGSKSTSAAYVYPIRSHPKYYFKPWSSTTIVPTWWQQIFAFLGYNQPAPDSIWSTMKLTTKTTLVPSKSVANSPSNTAALSTSSRLINRALTFLVAQSFRPRCVARSY